MREYYERGKLIWVAAGAVKYTPEHVELLLPWLEHMREGAYPPEPFETGYDSSPQKGISHHAPYEIVCQIAAELDLRLARTGLDRYLVEDVFCHGFTAAELSRRLGMDEWEIGRRIRSAVTYIASGPCPRWLDCIDCPRYRSCRRKKRAGIIYRQWRRSRRPKAKKMRLQSPS